MSHVSKIEYSSRAELVAAIPGLRKTEGVEGIDIVDNGRTLRVTSSGDAPLEGVEASETPAEPATASAAPVAPAESSETPAEDSDEDTPAESADEDLIGETPKPARKKGRQ